MKWKKKQASSVPAVKHRIAMRGGVYSLLVTAVVLALLIVLNIMVGALPTTLTKYDISSSRLYSITSNTKVVVNNLEQDVTIYWIVQADAEDDVIENLLHQYESLSSHIEVVKKNPDVFPTFTQTYTSETVPNNSLIVESGERYRYVSYDDIYQGELNYYTGSYNYTEFDGEGAITSAIDYVVTEDLPVVYTLEGHGESALPSIFADQVEKENIEVASLSLLTVDEIPEDADAILIYAPTSDISEEERDMLAAYAEDGGKLLVMAGPTEDGTLTTLYSLLSDYSYSSGANGDLAMNALSSLIGEREAMAIRSKSLNYNYLTISDSTSTVLKTLMIGVFPLVYLAIGVSVLLTRKKVQNETV